MTMINMFKKIKDKLGHFDREMEIIKSDKDDLQNGHINFF